MSRPSSTRSLPPPKYDYFAKMIVIGNSGVGKTNLLLNFCDQEYQESYVATIGVDFKVKTLQVQGCKLRLQLWDTAGQERFRNLTKAFYKGASGIVLVYSVTDRDSFTEIESWLKQIQQFAHENALLVIAGNKVDVEHQNRVVTVEEAEALAKKHGVKHFEVSAKIGTNVTELFNSIGTDIVRKLEKQSINRPPVNTCEIRSGEDSTKPHAKKKCC